ncbi:MarR family winged helix-turn-helix transcriptional regulator, partial [Streptomyces cacaoi]
MPPSEPPGRPPGGTTRPGGGSGEQPPPVPGLLEFLPRLTRLSHVVTRGRLVERAMDAAGVRLDRPAMSVLITLHSAERPLRVGEIAERLQVVGPHVTRQVNGLRQRGLVHRVTDPGDQRARLVELTDEGRQAAERYLGTVLGWFVDALAHWSEEDRRDLGRLLGRFADDVVAHLRRFEDADREDGEHGDGGDGSDGSDGGNRDRGGGGRGGGAEADG